MRTEFNVSTTLYNTLLALAMSSVRQHQRHTLRELDGMTPDDLSSIIYNIIYLQYLSLSGEIPLDYIKDLMSFGANPCFISTQGSTLLTYTRNVDLVQTFLDYGSDEVINVRDHRYGYTALHHLIYDNRLDIIKMHLKHHADPNIQDYMDRTTIYRAAELGRMGIYRYLLAQGADPMIPDRSGKTAKYHYDKNLEFMSYEDV